MGVVVVGTGNGEKQKLKIHRENGWCFSFFFLSGFNFSLFFLGLIWGLL